MVSGRVGQALAAYLLGRSVEAPECDILGEIGGLAQQHTVSGEAEDVADAVTLAEGDRFDAAVMAVATDQDPHTRPAGTDLTDDMARHARDLGAIGRLAGTQEDRHRLAGGGLMDMDGQEAVAVVMGVEQRELLAAMHVVLGVVDVEHNALGDLGEAVAEQIDHRRHHALERERAGQVLQPVFNALHSARRSDQPVRRIIRARAVRR
jgi:hypothetical protein